MIIQTSAEDNEDLDLLCNTLNAQAGRFLYSDPHLYTVILRAQAAIVALENKLMQIAKLTGYSGTEMNDKDITIEEDENDQ